MRVPTILLLGVLALIPSTGVANHNRKVDALVFSIHVDLAAQFDLADLQRALEDARALFQGSEGPESAPRWRYLYLRDQKLAGILRRAAITGVAMSGQPEAVAALRALGERVRDDPSTTDELRVHVREAERLCDRVVREGPDQVFGSGAVP